MDEKQLVKANVLATRIKGLEKQMAYWKEATGLMLLALRISGSDEIRTVEIDPYLIDFEKLRQEALGVLEQRLSELKAEFASL